MIAELVSLELLFQLGTTGDCAWDAIEDEMLLNGVDMPSNFQAVEVCLVMETNLSKARWYINMAYNDLMEHMREEFFEPSMMSFCISGYVMAKDTWRVDVLRLTTLPLTL